jgi:hypothetical protein
MKLASDTLTVLQNFASINGNIKFRKGKQIKTVSQGKSVLATANLSQEFPEDFCVHDLNQFLVVYNLNKDTDIQLSETDIVFKSGRSKTNYRKTDEKNCVLPPDRELSLPSVDVEVTLSAQDLADTLKAASVLKSTHIAIETDKSNEKIYITTCDPKDDSAHTNSIEISDNTSGKEFTFIFGVENFKMIPGEYSVQLSSKGLALFKNIKVDLQYFITMEKKYATFDNKKVG